MGKKKGGAAQAAPKKKQQEMSNKDFDSLLADLSKATKENDGLKTVQISKKDHKAERKEKLAAIKREKAEQEEARLRSRQQLQQVMEMIQRQQMDQAMMYPYLEEPDTKKVTEEKEDSKHMVSIVSMQGWRKSMEDAHIAKLEGDGYSMYAVFDGHSGAEVAEYAAVHLEKVLKGTEEWGKKDYEAALTKGFMAMDAEMREKKLEAGSTATVCLIVDGTIYTANSGDSRAVLCEGGKTIALSEDHKPMNDIERTRIEKAGSSVDPMNNRVEGSLAVSRGFGDFSFKAKDVPAEEQPVTAFPDITKHKITKDTEFLFVACDGIWDCKSNEEIVEQFAPVAKAAKKPSDLTTPVTQLFDTICSTTPGVAGSDNMSVVMVKFK